MKIVRYIAWAWIIIVGVLMITPNGVQCIACGATLNLILAVLSIVLGAVGIYSEIRGGAMTRG
jgi:hypothetical protein